MSWGGYLPAWILFEESAEQEAMRSCAMPDEWNAGISREVPEHLWLMRTACFESYNEGGWNALQ